MANQTRRDRLFWAILACQMTVFCAWQTSHLEGFQWSTDEGTYLMRVRLLDQGYALYRDVWTDQLPGLIMMLRATIAVFGPSVQVGRALIVVLTSSGLVGLAWLARNLGARTGGLLAVAMLAVAPNVYWLSRAIISPDLPSMSLGALSLALASEHLRRRRPTSIWLLISGACGALAILVKATAMLVLIPVGTWLVWRCYQWRCGRPRWRAALTWGAIGGVTVAAVLLLHHPMSMWQQFVVTQVASADSTVKIASHARKIAAYLAKDNWGLAGLGALGIVVGVRRRTLLWRLATSWLGISLLALLVRSPMWPSHHLVVLLFPLALLGAECASSLWADVAARRLWARDGVLIAGMLVWGTSLPGCLKADAALARPPEQRSAETAVAYLQDLDLRPCVVVSDYQMIPYRAGCSVPPRLATITKKRLQSGLLTAAELIRETETSSVGAILFWDEQISKVTPYVRWAKANYVLGLKWAEHEVYARPPAPQHSTLARFGSSTELIGYDIVPLATESGGTLQVTLYWRTLSGTEVPLVSFVHLLNLVGDEQLAQSDHLPWGDAYPSTLWSPGEVIVDTHTLTVPRSACSGPHLLSVGLYEEPTGQRLAGSDAAGSPLEGDQLILGVRPVVWWPFAAEPHVVGQPVGLVLGSVAELVSWYATNDNPGIMRVYLTWKARGPADWPCCAVFVQLRGASGIVAQHDGQPADGAAPVYAWRTGEYIEDAHTLALPADTLGTASLYVGMYDPVTGQRLQVADLAGVMMGDEIPLDAVSPRGR